jgi:GTP-binding protein
MLVISKCDMLDEELTKEMETYLTNEFQEVNYLMISSVAQQGLQILKDKLWQMLNQEDVVEN